VAQKHSPQPDDDAATPRKRRGRPRAYDPKEALRSITEAFWKSGYSGTSLDELSAATGMNRPSLYAAFGDKREVYLAALNRYWANSYEGMRRALDNELPLRQALMNVFEAAMSLYYPEKGRARGCFAIGTATTESVQDPKIRAALAEGLRRLDHHFEERILAAQKRGELAADRNASTMASLASATLHTIAIRARAGVERQEMLQFARNAVDAICGD
jgi:AcrR family transcriptional regulator